MSLRNIIFLLLIGMTACNQPNQAIKAESQGPTAEVPAFNVDSAYAYTAAQVAFGPRVPNTQAHRDCGNYLADQLKRFGASVTEQAMTLQTYDNILLDSKNIIGSFQPEAKSRILLFAHWDSRPFADEDPDPANHRKAIDGANDGAGACGVLLEIARQLSVSQTKLGIDIIFFDAEDWGVPSFDTKNQGRGGWCLGSDYWSKNPHVINYKARYGILLDMVSAPGATFYKEGYSIDNASNVVKKVWDAAASLGYGSYFINQRGISVEDDHVHVMQNRNIPCIDIIQQELAEGNGFGDYWHTLNDNMDHVSRETMKAVGQTVLQVIYNEK